jgi:hypothetical protein
MKNLLWLFLLASLSLQAQVKAGKKYLNKKQYEAAFNAFTLDLEHKKNGAEAAFLLAKLYINKDFPEKNTLKAYQYSQKALEKLKKADAKTLAHLQKQGIGNLSIKKLQADISTLAYDEAMSGNNVSQLDTFLMVYDAQISSQTEKASQKRNQLAFEAAQRENTWSAYKAFFSKYHANAKVYSPQIDSVAQLELFESYIRQHGWYAYGSFGQDYPDNPYVQDSALAVKFILRTQKNTWEAYEEFYKDYPKSKFVRIAADSLLRLAERSQRMELFDFWVRTFPDHPAHRRAWKGLYQLFKVKSREEEFKQNYPNCPLKAEDLY